MRNVMTRQMRFHKTHIEVMSPDPIRPHEGFGWMNDEGKVEYPKPWIAEECVNPRRPREEAGKEWAERSKAALCSDCGTRVPGQKILPGAQRGKGPKERKKARRDLDVGLAKVRRSNARITFLRIRVGKKRPAATPLTTNIASRMVKLANH